MFLNILRISASNVLKTFLNIIVSIGCILNLSLADLWEGPSPPPSPLGGIFVKDL